jgi:hypothetical protein
MMMKVSQIKITTNIRVVQNLSSCDEDQSKMKEWWRFGHVQNMRQTAMSLLFYFLPSFKIKPSATRVNFINTADNATETA